MTVKELINELLECHMDSEVNMRIKLHDMDLDYDSIEFETDKLGGGWGRQLAVVSVNLEDKTSQEFADSIGEE